MDSPIKATIKTLILIFAIANVSATTTEPLKSAVETRLQAQQDVVTSQKTVDSLAEQTKDAARQYREAIQKSNSLDIYNKQLTKLIKQQKKDLASIQRQLDNVEETQRNIVPLMIKMINTLDKFVALDLPFLLKERRQRIAFLKEIIDRPDVTLPDKYRRIMEAYQIEMEYGRTIEAYTDTINLNGKKYTVDILRVGRLLIAFQTREGSQSGIWDKQSKSWQKLSSEYNRSINKGLQIAKKQAPPELIKLPINATGK